MNTILVANVLTISICVLSLALVIAATRLALWTRGIPHRAARKVARETGVSEDYVRAVVVHCDTLYSGEVSGEEWLRRSLALARRYPVESGLRIILQEGEGLL